MKKLLLVFLILSHCSYKPIIDSAGQSGTFSYSKASEITNDLQHCKALAEDNTSFLGNLGYWIFSPTMDTKYESYYRRCLTMRGHSVID